LQADTLPIGHKLLWYLNESEDLMSEDRNDRIQTPPVWRIILFVVVVWAMWMAFAFYTYSKGGIGTAGQFGDSFGGFTSLFTALAFAAVWWTGNMQRIELIEQRKELKLQREEIASTRAVHTRQQFESTFFRMLELLRELHDDIRTTSQDRGASSVRAIADSVKHSIEKGAITFAEDPSEAERIYERAIGQHYDLYFSPYFRILFNILRLIDNTFPTNEADRSLYGNIVRAQISNSMAEILALNCLTERSGNMLDYVRRYRMLRYMPDSMTRNLIERRIGHEAFSARE
jgi:hypothetical protein